jgi:hypothetical protein
LCCVSFLFELCRLPQQPSLTLHPLGGSTPRMWLLFLLGAKGKRKEMTGTQHVGTLKIQFLQYITIKNVFVLFYYQNNFEMNYSCAIWWRHLPAACNNFFEAGVSGNSLHQPCSRVFIIIKFPDSAVYYRGLNLMPNCNICVMPRFTAYMITDLRNDF